ncbi:MAG: trypsin-like peptidase domain-containing protein [Nitrospinota bacterium]
MRRRVGIRVTLVMAVLLLFWASAPFALAADEPAGLTVKEIIELKEVGFPEKDIRAEITRSKGRYKLSAKDLKRLKKVGFSKEFLSFLESLRPKKKLTNKDIAELVKRGLSAEEILKEIRESEKDFEATPRAILNLVKKHKVPRVVARAVQGRALTYEDLKDLGRQGASGAQLLLLLDIVGFQGEKLSPAQAVELSRAKVPREVVAWLRKPPKKEAKPELAKTGDLPQPGFYPHPLGLFTLRYPEDWTQLKEVKDGNVLYTVTPEKGKERADDVTTSFQLIVEGIEENALATKMTPQQALERIVTLFLHEEPGLRVQGASAEAKMGDLPAARQTFKGTLKGKQGQFRADVYLAVKGKFMYMAAATASEERFGELSDRFEQILKKSSFIPVSGGGRKKKAYTVEELASRHKAAVVSVKGKVGEGLWSTGTGFLIREDGYLLTNHHVIWNEEKKRPATQFTVEWDDSLNLPKKEAKLIAFKRQRSHIAFNFGIDIALLKIPAERPYKTFPLSPLSHVRLGDQVMTMGFPSRGMDVSTLSTFVTSGVVTRFNRDFRGRTEGILTTAPITGGNSGGPALSLATGGAIGLNTWGFSEKTILRENPDLVAYKGVVPIDFAIREFPLATQISAEREKTLDYIDYFDLALRSADFGVTSAAVRMAEKAVKKNDRSADALSLLGRLQVSAAGDRKEIKAGFKTLEKALALDPKHLDTLLFLAQANLELNEIVKAVKYADRAVEAEPTDWRVYVARANINLSSRRHEEALKDLEKAKQQSREVLPQPYILAGRALFAMGRLEDGRRDFLKALELQPSNLEARMELAQYHMLKKNYVAALLEYDKLNTERPNTPHVMVGMARAYVGLKKFQKAALSYHDSITWSNKLGLMPAEEALVERARITHRQLKKAKLAVKFYADYLLPYFGAKGAYDVHMEMADIVKRRFSEGIALGHFMNAAIMTQDEKAKSDKATKEIESLAKKRVLMSKADIKLMLKLKYHPAVAGKIIQATYLDFWVNPKDEKQIAALFKKGFPKDVVIGILVSSVRHEKFQKQRMRARRQRRDQEPGPARGQRPGPQARRLGPGPGPPGQQPGPAEPPPPGRGPGAAGAPPPGPPPGQGPQARRPIPANLAGTWVGHSRTTRGFPVQVTITLQRDGQYQSALSVGGFPQNTDRGTYTVNQNLIVLRSISMRDVLVRIVGNRLMLDLQRYGYGIVYFTRGG